MKQRRIWNVITAAITVAIALPQLISRTAARATPLKPFPLAVDFPRCFHVEISRDRDERHLVGIDCIADWKEIRAFFDIGFHKIGGAPPPTPAEVVKGRRPTVDAGGRARCRNTPVAGIDSPPQIAPAVRRLVSLFNCATASVANLPDYVHMGNTSTVAGSLTSCPGQED
jgi:hypothetical protein